MAIPKRAKVWVCAERARWHWAEIHTEEPVRFHENGWWEAEHGWSSPDTMLIEAVQDMLGITVPPHPYLVEIERVGDRLREVCVWEPCDE